MSLIPDWLHHEFQASLNQMARPCLKDQQQIGPSGCHRHDTSGPSVSRCLNCRLKDGADTFFGQMSSTTKMPDITDAERGCVIRLPVSLDSILGPSSHSTRNNQDQDQQLGAKHTSETRFSPSV